MELVLVACRDTSWLNSWSIEKKASRASIKQVWNTGYALSESCLHGFERCCVIGFVCHFGHVLGVRHLAFTVDDEDRAS